MIFHYNNLEVRVEEKPIGDFDGFEYRFYPLSPKDNLPIFLLIMACPKVYDTSTDRDTLHGIGKRILVELIETKTYEHRGYHCYLWESLSNKLEIVSYESIYPSNHSSRFAVMFTQFPPTESEISQNL